MSNHVTKYNISNYHNKFLTVLALKKEPIVDERRDIFIIKGKIYKRIKANIQTIRKIHGLTTFLSKIEYSPVHFDIASYSKYKRLCSEKLPIELANDCIAVMEYTKRDKQCRLEIRQITASELKFSVYKKILDAYYTYIANWILQGYVFSLGPHLGKIYIKEKHKNFINVFGDVTALVNRAASAELLDRIAEEQEKEGLHTLYTEFKIKKHYTRVQFIHLMKPYTYSPNRPELPKWIIYHTDDWIPYFQWTNRDNTMIELNAYTYKPTSFINTPSRKKGEILEKAKSIDDILDCKDLGNKDKMFLIKRFDNNYYTHTRNDIS